MSHGQYSFYPHAGEIQPHFHQRFGAHVPMSSLTSSVDRMGLPKKLWTPTNQTQPVSIQFHKRASFEGDPQNGFGVPAGFPLKTKKRGASKWFPFKTNHAQRPAASQKRAEGPKVSPGKSDSYKLKLLFEASHNHCLERTNGILETGRNDDWGAGGVPRLGGCAA